MALFTNMMPFLERLRNHKNNAQYEDNPPAIHSLVKEKEVVITEELIRTVLEFGYRSDDPIGFLERLVRGCFKRMGYKGHVKAANYAKSCVLRPYKFLMHVVIHALGHRK
ncbi:hypothetical protein Hanom_Chr00s000006g01613891 [Helianthus anomalus]